MSLSKLKKDLRKYATKKRATNLSRFFKTGPGEYGEGDKFIGVTVSNCRKIVRKYKNLSLTQTQKLLNSKIHEERLIALLILVRQFEKANEITREKIYNFYLKNIKFVNNWDLVDLSSHKIIGGYLYENPHCATTLQGTTLKGSKLLNYLAKSENLWERRIAIISTAAYIRRGDFDKTLEIAEILLNDKRDLIHKAVGWMLREVGKKNQATEESFLKKHYKTMPRTMLRYAIEKFDEKTRKAYLKDKI